MIRPARPDDAEKVAQIAQAAYAPLAKRMDTPPAPMLDDYPARVGEGVVWVLEDGADVLGFIILVDREDALLLENVAVAPEAHGRGAGRRLVAFAEAEAAQRGHSAIRLYTHATMVENQAIYAHLGYERTGQGMEDGYDRVQFEKRL
ncbi:MAG: GNAT family N-acetyltransferase [Pseudomonadota bacterium]